MQDNQDRPMVIIHTQLFAQDAPPDLIVVLHTDPITQDTLDALEYESKYGVRVSVDGAKGPVMQVGPELITDQDLAAVWAAMTTGVGRVPAVDQEYELCPVCAAIDARIAASNLISDGLVSVETMTRLFGLGDNGATGATGADDTFGQVY